MKQNIRSGYRAGGQAPYGYKLEKFEFGKHRSGETITKTKLIPDPETSKIAREYFERRSKLETRRSILEDFYHRGIPSPNGMKAWPVATAKSMEDNIEVYLGHTVFNRHNERVKIRGKLDGRIREAGSGADSVEGDSRSPMDPPSSWTKSVNFSPRHRPSCFGCFRRGRSSSAAARC